MPELNTDDNVELTIGRRQLQVYSGVIAFSLSLLSFFVYRAAESFDKMADTVAKLTVYAEVHSEKNRTLEARLDKHISFCEPTTHALKEEIIFLKSVINR